MDVSDPFDPPKRSKGPTPSPTRKGTASSDDLGVSNARSNVFEMIRPFDPMSADAETHYDDVARRVNRIRARRARNDRERLELERQFIENDLVVRGGVRVGLPLSVAGRRKRMQRLFQLTIEAERLASEEQFSMRALERMNDALDRWARDTYGQ